MDVIHAIVVLLNTSMPRKISGRSCFVEQVVSHYKEIFDQRRAASYGIVLEIAAALFGKHIVVHGAAIFSIIA
jgi:hypothetical protein